MLSYRLLLGLLLLLLLGAVGQAHDTGTPPLHLISAMLDNQPYPATLSFAVRDEAERASVQDKALPSIPPDEPGIISNRGRTHAIINNQGWRHYRHYIYPIAAASPLVLAVILIWHHRLKRQICRRRATEMELNEQLRFMQSLLNGIPHPIYVRDSQGRLLSCNQHYLQELGLCREQTLGKTALEIKDHQDEARGFHEDYLAVMRNGVAMACDRTLHAHGQEIGIYHWIQPYRDANRKIAGVICGWVDISERRQLVRALQEAKDMADAANRAKTTFLATMSHEIRTPMNAIIGMLELALKKAEWGQSDHSAIDVAYQSARDLLKLLGDILDVARIESGKLFLAPERANVRELVAAVTRMFDGQVRQKGLNLRLELGPRLDREVLIDPLRFKQILSNLVSNAIKFTDNGSIIIRADSREKDAGQLALDVSVEDSGIGIADQDQQRLFRPFSQLTRPRQGDRGGTGLGLMICRSLCDMMGGELRLSSRPGQGTRVDVSLTVKPLAPAASGPKVAAPTPTGPPMRVLVVDDHAANRLLLGQQLAYLGHQVHEAKDGAQGLALWQQTRPDLVITDCNMPVINGYQLAEAIRRQERELGLAACTLFGFTANAQPEEYHRCRQAGMDDCLFKPVSLTALGARLADCQPLPEHDHDSARVANLCEAELLTGGEATQMRPLLRQLIESNREDAGQLRTLLARQQWQAMPALAHKIKGAARIIRADAVIAGCKRLEQRAEASAVRALLDALAELERQLTHYLDTL